METDIYLILTLEKKNVKRQLNTSNQVQEKRGACSVDKVDAKLRHGLVYRKMGVC